MDLFITGFGAALLPVRFMRLNRKDLYYPLSSFGQTLKKTLLYKEFVAIHLLSPI